MSHTEYVHLLGKKGKYLSYREGVSYICLHIFIFSVFSFNTRFSKVIRSADAGFWQEADWNHNMEACGTGLQEPFPPG